MIVVQEEDEITIEGVFFKFRRIAQLNCKCIQMHEMLRGMEREEWLQST